METYAARRAWADQFIPQAMSILGRYLLKEASLEVDAKQSTDFVMFTADPMDIAFRVRRNRFAASGLPNRYAWDMTFRTTNPHGPSEHEKICSGFADWLLYAWADAAEEKIADYTLVDLDFFRRSREGSGIKKEEQTNDDGSAFIAYDIRSFPKGLILGATQYPEGKAPWD